MSRLPPVKSNSPLSVAFMVGSFFPEAKGACYAAERLAEGLRRRGCQITFITNTQTGWQDNVPYKEFPVRTYFFKGTGMARKFWSLLRFLLHLKTGKIQAQIIHIHGGGHMHFLAARFVQLFCSKKVLFKITLNGWDTPDGVKKLKWSKVTSRAFMEMDGVVAMTSGQAETCRLEGYKGSLEVIPNAVDLQRFSPVGEVEKSVLRRELDVDNFEAILVYVGVIDQRKGIDLLLPAFRTLRKQFPQLGLLLVGAFLQEDLSNYEIEEVLGLKGQAFPWEAIRRVGRVDDVERYMQASDIFVFPSRQEGFGTVQIEAMACGLPCVVGRIPGVTEDIFPDHQTGSVVDAYSARAFATAVQHLLENPGLRKEISVAARQRAVNHFGVEQIADRYRSLYERLTTPG